MTAVAKAQLMGDKVVVTDDFIKAQPLYSKSAFGEVRGTSLEFSLVEAAFLLEQNKIKIIRGSQELKPNQFITSAQRKEKNFLKRYSVYRDMRLRGYVLKTALKFGADFRVYARGKKPGKTHAKWILFCVSEGDRESWREFSAKNRVAHSTRKNLLIGIVDDEGDVTYYEITWVKP